MIFHDSLMHVNAQGRHPVVCLLGPDMQEAFEDHCGTMSDWVKMKPSDPWIKTVKEGDLGTYNGIRLRKMNQNGLALVTHPVPGSSFDIP
jgi:hypothetical protein